MNASLVDEVVEAARRRLVGLQAPEARAALHAEHVAATIAVEEGAVEAIAAVPGPWDHVLVGASPQPSREVLSGARLSSPEASEDADWGGVQEVDGRIDTVCFFPYDLGRVELQSLVMERGRLGLQMAFTNLYPRGDGQPRGEFTEWVYDERGFAVLAVSVYESGQDPSWRPELGAHFSTTARRFTVRDDGWLERVEHVIGPSQVGFEAPVSSAFAEARAAYLESPERWRSSVQFDGRIAGLEIDIPAPHAAFDALAPALADDLVRIAAESSARLGELEFAYVTFDPRSGPKGLGSISMGLADAAWTARARLLVGGGIEVLHAAGAWDGGIYVPDVLGGLSERVARRLRAGRRALHQQPIDLVEHAEDAFRLALAQELNQRTWTRARSSFLAVIHEWSLLFDPAAKPHPLTRQAVGDDRFEALVASLPARKRPRLARDLRAADARQLITTLSAQGLTTAEATRVATDARWAVCLEPAADGTSRIGGPATMPATQSWPTTNHGSPLCHLATVRLDDLPAVPGREDLPEDGYLSFFADTISDDDDHRLAEPVEPGDSNRDQVAVLYTTEQTAALHSPPTPEAALPEQACRPTGRLQLRPTFVDEVEERYSLDGLGWRVLDRVTERVNGMPFAQMLGWPPVVQGDPRTADEVALFHLPEAASSAFNILDGGDLFFYAPRESTNPLNEDRVTVWPSSG